MEWYSRTSSTKPYERVSTHLLEVAELAHNFAYNIYNGIFQDFARLSGLWHDLGKCSYQFLNRLNNGRIVDHSTAGAIRVRQEWFKLNPVFSSAEHRLPPVIEMLQHCIAGHHTGLLNTTKIDKHNALIDRTNRCECVEGAEDICTRCGLRTIPRYYPVDEIIDIGRIILDKEIAGPAVRNYTSLSLLTRMLYSCLVDADSLCSARYANDEEIIFEELTADLITKLLDKLHKHRLSLNKTPMDNFRSEILAHCIKSADKLPGLFSFTVPTGGGKTLSSLEFALLHALKYDKCRIIYVAPYTTIIDQTVKIFRSILGDKYVLEHHSNIDSDINDTAIENWNSQIIVTTTIQFYESLFSNRRSKLRKLHNITNSIIILDEVQTLPVHVLQPCLIMMKELVDHYKCSIILCTATQPALDKRKNFNIGLEDVREIVDNHETIYNSIHRTKSTSIGILSDVELAYRLLSTKQSLCIVNTVEHAYHLFQVIKSLSGESGHIFHLSTMMYSEHRLRTIAEIIRRLKNNEKCIVISTSLIESGIDIDFPEVYRAINGLDQIIQANGRCNRSGLLQNENGDYILGSFYIFTPENEEYLGGQEIAINTTKEIINFLRLDVLEYSTITKYFELYLWKNTNYDTAGILKLSNSKNIAYHTIADRFKLIEDYGIPIIIQTEENRSDITSLLAGEHTQELHRKLQRYIVNARYSLRELNQLITNGIIQTNQDDTVQPTQLDLEEVAIYILVDNSYYLSSTGLRLPRAVNSITI